MKNKDWKRKINRPTTEQLNEKIAARLRALEDELRDKQCYIVLGIEQEFFVSTPYGGPINLSDDEIHKLFENTKPPLLQKVKKEIYPAGKYEITFSNMDSNNMGAAGFYPSIELARSVLQARTQMLESFHKVSPNGKLAFSATRNQKQTSGFHTNSSAWLKDSNVNLFYRSDGFSPLALTSAAYLLQMQKEGLRLYAPLPKSFFRFGRNESAPTGFFACFDKGTNSLALRKDYKNERYNDDFYRIEDRLACADVNPFLPILANVGAIWLAVLQPDKAPKIEITEDDSKKKKSPATPIFLRPDKLNSQSGKPLKSSRMVTQARQRFERSELWRMVAGEELYQDLVNYFKPRTLDEVQQGK